MSDARTPTERRYELRTLKDLIDIPPECLSEVLDALGAALHMHHLLTAVGEERKTPLGLKGFTFEWVDDGTANATLYDRRTGKPLLGLTSDTAASSPAPDAEPPDRATTSDTTDDTRDFRVAIPATESTWNDNRGWSKARSAHVRCDAETPGSCRACIYYQRGRAQPFGPALDQDYDCAHMRGDECDLAGGSGE